MSPIVETNAGKVSGGLESGIPVFRGIPYGADTAGAGRFRPPAPPVPWSGVRAATTDGPTAPQAGAAGDSPLAVAMGGGRERPPIGEDCLALNVFTPSLDGSRPVLVYLHGGGYDSGSGTMIDGGPLARRGDVVVVTVNHRLGLLGYLYLDELADGRYPGSGIVSLLDIVAALEWVREHIASFGGDPGNVMIFGESGGGLKVSMLQGMPAAKGLFHKAVVQSGPAIRGVNREDATRQARRVLEALGLDERQLDALHDLPVERLVEVASTLSSGAQGGAALLSTQPKLQFGPVVDGSFLPAHPFEPVAAPSSEGVPLMIGTTKDEFRAFVGMMPNADAMSFAEAEGIARSFLGDRADGVLDLYARTSRAATPVDLLAAVFMTDALWIDSIRLAERKMASSSAPVYVYRFDYETDVLGGALKAAHGLDVPFVFDVVESSPFTGSRPERIELAHAMADAWVAFARCGDPNHEGLPTWARYDTTERTTMLFDCPSHVEADPLAEVREGLDALGVKVDL